MRLQLEATAEEFAVKGEAFLEAIQQAVRPYSEELADSLEKALPAKEEILKYPVLQELEKRTGKLYEEHLEAMIKEIFAVLQDGVQKSEEEGDFEKAGGPYIGPKGGMWADPEHTQHWDPDKEHGEGGEKKEEPKKEAEEKEPEFYPDDVAVQKLEDIGESLFYMQAGMHNVIDKTGFSSHDFHNWHSVKGDLNKMKHVLSKYKKQISNGWGAEEYHKLGLGQAPAASQVKPYYHSNFGSLMLPVDGFIAKPAFKAYLDYHKALKAKGLMSYDGTAWYIYKKHLADFPWAEYVQKMAELGIKLPEEMPQPPPPKEPPKQVEPESGATVDQVIAGILSKKVHDKLAVKRDKDGKFSFYYPYNPSLNELFSNKSGMLTGITKYNPENHARETFQLELVEEALEKIKKLAPELEIVTDGVKEARIEKDAELAELQKPIPEIAAIINPKYQLYPYQNECVRFLDAADGNALIGDEMGLGKTLQSLAWCAKNKKKVVVVAPRVVRRTWLQEAVKFFPGYFKGAELISSDIKKGKVPDLSDANVVTVNYESLIKFLPQIKAAGFDTIIVDESHRMKNPKAKVTQAIQAVSKIPTMKHHILLSGTAIKNKKDELYTQLGLVAPGKFSKQALKYGTIGGLWMDMRAVYLARQKATVLKDLPEKTTQIIEHPAKEGVPDLDELEDLEPSQIIGRFSQMKTEIAVAKAPETLEFVHEILDSSDSKVVLFTDSVEAAHYLAEQLGDLALLHTGEMSLDKQEVLKKEFERQDEEGNFISPKRVFVATRQSLAVGATLVAADKVVFNDLPWTIADIRQAEDRCHRIGQKSAVTVYWSKLAGNAFDENIINILKRKFELSKKVNQGQQATDEEKAWLNKAITLNELIKQYQGDKAGPGKTSSLGPALPDLDENGEPLTEEKTKEKASQKLPVPVDEPAPPKQGEATPKKTEASAEPPKAPAAISIGTLDPLVLGAGGKIEENAINPTHYDIKIPKGKPEVMAEIQDSFDLHAKVREDWEHLIITVPKSAIAKFLSGSDILKALAEEDVDVVYSSGGGWSQIGNARAPDMGLEPDGSDVGALSLSAGALWDSVSDREGVPPHAGDGGAECGGVERVGNYASGQTLQRGSGSQDANGGHEGGAANGGDNPGSGGGDVESGQGFADVTEPILEREGRAYERVKQVLMNLGWKETDFLDGGPLYGWSVNQLIDLARDNRGSNADAAKAPPSEFDG